LGLVPAILVSVEPAASRADGESTEPTPQPDDLLITRNALERARIDLPFKPRALILRTLPNHPNKRHHDYTNQPPPYLTRETAQWLVEHHIEHLVVDLPSIDRAHDEGRLTAHRIFFGLPRGDIHLVNATRAHATVTELAYIPEALADGPYLLEIQVPA